MKKILCTLLFLIHGIVLFGQDVFQEELFSTNLVLKYRNEIGLSSEQVTNVKKIYDDHIHQFTTIKWDLDTEHVDLKKLLAFAKVNEKNTLSKMKKILELEDKLKEIKLIMLIKIKNQLSSVQQGKLRELRTDKDIKEVDLITFIGKNPNLLVLNGNGSKTKLASPLYILKDKTGTKEISATYFQNFDHNKIESISVFKDKNAIKKYGEKSKNGVVVITLKE